MKPDPISAAPDLMRLLCLIGGAMREAGPSGLWMQLLLIGTICPRFGLLLETWLRAEERLAVASASDDAWGDEAGGDEAGQAGSGWISREGPVWRWRQVTRFGSVLVIPVRWFAGFAEAASLLRGPVWGPAWSLAPAVRALFFRSGLSLSGEPCLIRYDYTTKPCSVFGRI